MNSGVHRLKHLFNNHQIPILTLVVIAFFGIFLKPSFATDTYAEVYSGLKGSMHFLQDGRPLTAGFSFLFNVLQIDIKIIDVLSTTIALPLLVISIYQLASTVKAIIKDERLRYLCAFLIIVNPFTIELFLFIERGVMVLSILFCVLALKYLVRAFEQWNRRSIIRSIIMMTLAVFCYQGTAGFFAVLAAALCILYPAKNQHVLRRLLLSATIFTIPVICNYLFIKISSTNTGRTDSAGINLSANVHEIFTHLNHLFSTLGIIPTPIVLTFFASVIVILAVLCLKNRRLKHFILAISSFLLIFGVATLSATIPQLFQNFVHLAPRSCYGFGAIFGISAVIAFVFGEIKLGPSFAKLALSIAVIAFLGITFFRFQTIAISHFNTNAIDQARALWIEAEIEKYQNNSGKTIDTISVAEDKALTDHYSGIDPCGSGNVSSFSRSWSDVKSLNYYTGRNYQRKTANDSEASYCRSQDWQSLDLEQFQFEDNTMLMCVY